MRTSAVHGAKAKTRLGRFLKRDHERGDWGTFEAGQNDTEMGSRDRSSGRSWQGSSSCLHGSPPGFHSFCARARSCLFVQIACKLPLRTKQYSRSKPSFSRGSRVTRIPAFTGESHAGHAFAVLHPDQFGRRFARRYARRPGPLEVVATEPASDIDRLADEI
jgi:hypothetical protein